jgi:hypothetical protein
MNYFQKLLKAIKLLPREKCMYLYNFAFIFYRLVDNKEKNYWFLDVLTNFWFLMKQEAKNDSKVELALFTHYAGV